MYHIIMRSKVREVFDSLNKGDYQPVLTSLAPTFEHWFLGDHALSGLRTSLAATRAWYERLYRIFPDLCFDLHSLVVQGGPWDTVVTVEWTDAFTLRNGKRMSNRGVHILRFQWAKAVSIRIYCDTKLLLDSLAVQAQNGLKEASLPPLIG